MELDCLIFPSPDTSYSYDKSNGELIFIPKNQDPLSNINNQNSNNLQINEDPLNNIQEENGKNDNLSILNN